MAEIKGFGWNALTFSFFATVVFAILGAWGQKDQMKCIWSEKSGKSVAVNSFSVIFALFVSFVIYGIQKSSLALIIGGALRVPFLFGILLGLWRFKGFTLRERGVVVALALGLLYMPFSSYRGVIFLIFTYLGVAATLLQAWEIWEKKSRGVVSIKMLVVYNTSVMFWVIYGLALDDKKVFVMGLSYVIAYTLTIILWLVYRNE